MNKGFISDIQHFSTGDGEGIRTTVFFQGCNLHCPWCHNPETIPLCGTTLNYPNLTKISGKEMTLDEIMKCILDDLDFYKESGGGVTFSGGEPLLQSEFCRELAKSCRSADINVIVDTAGCVSYDKFEHVIPYTDTFFFDLKAVNADTYHNVTGGSFELIYDNLKRLAVVSNVVVRIPVIPDHNSSEDIMQKYAVLLENILIKRVDLLPFHRLGSSKYEALGLKYNYSNYKSSRAENIAGYENIFKAHGISCMIER